jgi:hypothetical protein
MDIYNPKNQVKGKQGSGKKKEIFKPECHVEKEFFPLIGNSNQECHPTSDLSLKLDLYVIN